jgi:TetR/AcrR family transcriptional regulator
MKPIFHNRKRLPAEERRRQILASATKIFAQSNFQSARVADIAADVGVCEAAIYRYFPSKKAIYLELLKHMADRIITFWQAEVDRAPDAYQAMRNMAMTYYRRMVRHPAELKVQFQAIAEVEDPDIARQLHQDHERYLEFIAGVIRQGIEQGVIRKDVQAETLAWLFNGFGITMNMMMILSFKQQFDETVVRGIMDHLSDSIKA